jgi:hypothetical protein
MQMEDKSRLWTGQIRNEEFNADQSRSFLPTDLIDLITTIFIRFHLEVFAYLAFTFRC